jgi:hypothetical protein
MKSLTVIDRIDPASNHRLARIAKRNAGQLCSFSKVQDDQGNISELLVMHPQNTVALSTASHVFYGTMFEGFKGRRIRLESGNVYDVESPNGIGW